MEDSLQDYIANYFLGMKQKVYMMAMSAGVYDAAKKLKDQGKL